MEYLKVESPKGYLLRSDWASKVRSIHYQAPANAVLVCEKTGIIAEITHRYMHWVSGNFGYELKIISMGTADVAKPGEVIWAPQSLKPLPRAKQEIFAKE
jgi:hypothetical protein